MEAILELKMGCNMSEDRILECVGVSGEVKIGDLAIFDLSRMHTYRLITKLDNEGFIRTNTFDGYKTIRLTNIGKKYLMKKYPGKFDDFFSGCSETNKIRTEPNRRDRNLKLAQIKLMLYQANVNLFCDNKPLIAKNSFSNRTDGTDCVDCDYHFYTASELKTHFTPFMQSRNSRALGVLVAKNSICIFYNAGDRIMRWCEEDEKFFRANVSTQINQRFYRNSKIIRNIIVVTEQQMPSKILENDGGRKSTNLRVDRSIQNMHTIMYGVSDRIVLDMLIDKINYGAAMQNLIRNLGLSRKSEASQNIHDAYGRKVLPAFDMDLKKIDVYCRKLGVYDGRSVIYCLDFQKKYIEGYCGRACDIITVTEEEFRYAIE